MSRFIVLAAILAVAAASSVSVSQGAQSAIVRQTTTISRTSYMSQAEIDSLTTAVFNALGSGNVTKVLFAGQSLSSTDSIADLLDLPFADVVPTAGLAVTLSLYPNTVTSSQAALLTTVNSAGVIAKVQSAVAAVGGGSAVVSTATTASGATDCTNKCYVHDTSCPPCGAGFACTAASQCLSNSCVANKCGALPSSASAVAGSIVTVGALAVTATLARFL